MSWPLAFVLSVFIIAVSFTTITVVGILNVFKTPLKNISWQSIKAEEKESTADKQTVDSEAEMNKLEE